MPGTYAGQLEGVDETPAALAPSPVQQGLQVVGAAAVVWLCNLTSDTQSLPVSSVRTTGGIC